MIKVAIIDDEASTSLILSQGLSKNKEFQITTYTNPNIALATMRPGSFDVVLCDIVMPEMDGIEVLEKIKNIDNNVIVIMITGQSTLDRVLSSHKIGADYFILKPFTNIASIEQKILSLVEKR